MFIKTNAVQHLLFYKLFSEFPKMHTSLFLQAEMQEARTFFPFKDDVQTSLHQFLQAGHSQEATVPAQNSPEARLLPRWALKCGTEEAGVPMSYQGALNFQVTKKRLPASGTRVPVTGCYYLIEHKYTHHHRLLKSNSFLLLFRKENDTSPHF